MKVVSARDGRLQHRTINLWIGPNLDHSPILA